MTLKTKIVIAAVVTITAFAIGRYTTPVKVKTIVQTVEVEKKTQKTDTTTDKDTHKETTTTEVDRPDGTKETTTKVVEDTTTKKKSDTTKSDQSDTTETQTKEITKESSKLMVSALVGVNFASPTLIYGASVNKTLLGPITMGVWGLTNGTAGVSAGLVF